MTFVTLIVTRNVTKKRQRSGFVKFPGPSLDRNYAEHAYRKIGGGADFGVCHLVLRVCTVGRRAGGRRSGNVLEGAMKQVPVQGHTLRLLDVDEGAQEPNRTRKPEPFFPHGRSAPTECALAPILNTLSAHHGCCMMQLLSRGQGLQEAFQTSFIDPWIHRLTGLCEPTNSSVGGA